MGINLAMWKKATTQLVRMESKQEWDALDVVSKWLIATRSGVTTVTLYSCVIAGLFALRSGAFAFLPWLVMTVGLFLAHGANNLLNDYTDFSRGIDKDNYFRIQYGVHPLAQGFWSRAAQMRWFVVSGLLGMLSAVFALFYARFDPIVIGLFAYGSLMLLLYTYPLKHFALGELTIFLIWGPIMIGGVYLVLAHQWSWSVAVAGIPFGLSTASINIGKHIDKSGEDALKGVRTLPVLIGQTAARYVNMAAVVCAYAVTLYAVFVSRFLTPVLLIVLIAGPDAVKALRRLSQPRPAEPPAGYLIWPRWFSTVCFQHNRRFGNLFILGVAADTALRLIFPGFWR
ncbi:MAG: prenyltransferase [Spirochaetia bacterium]|jgi:1,4-dihydroxy-2-naphthoate octaprenyltransferase